MPVKLLGDGNQHLHDGTLQDGASTRAICVEKHGLEHPPSPHHEFVAVLGVGPELLKSSFFSHSMSNLLLQAKQPAHLTKGTPCLMLYKTPICHQQIVGPTRAWGHLPGTILQLPFSHAMRTRPFPAPRWTNEDLVHIPDVHHHEYQIHGCQHHVLWLLLFDHNTHIAISKSNAPRFHVVSTQTIMHSNQFCQMLWKDPGWWSKVVYLRPAFFVSKRWQSKDALQFVVPAENHVVLPVALLQVNLPCVPTWGTQTIYIANVHSQ